MSDINVEVLVNPVRQVLMEAAIGKGHHPQALTAYQIADRLSHSNPDLFKQLEAEKGIAGRGSMFNLIAKAGVQLALMDEVSITYMDAGGIEFMVAGGRINPSYQVIALYRLA